MGVEDEVPGVSVAVRVTAWDVVAGLGLAVSVRVVETVEVAAAVRKLATSREPSPVA